MEISNGSMRRVFDITEPVDSPKGDKLLWELAEKSLPKKDAGDYNRRLWIWALRSAFPKNPRCLICPLMKLCKARENGTQNQRPVKLPKKSVPHHIHVAGVIENKGKVVFGAPPVKGIARRNVGIPKRAHRWAESARRVGICFETGYNLRLRENRSKIRKTKAIGVVHHGYSHFLVSVHVYPCDVDHVPRAENLKMGFVKRMDEISDGKNRPPN